MNSRGKSIALKMLGYCGEVRKSHEYFHDNKDLFLNREDGFIYRNSITMPILQIGELAKRLSDEFLAEYKEVPWREIRGIRDIFAHHYGSVDFNLVWQTSHSDISALTELLQKAVETDA